MRPDWSRPVSARACVLAEDDVDTDQIVPARFLTSTTRATASAALFADRRARPGFFLDSAPEGAKVLVAGGNFGCGSSREHAAWALVDSGFVAVVAPSFAPIFRTNAVRNGLVPAVVSKENWSRLLNDAGQGDGLTVDLAGLQIQSDAVDPVPFGIDPFDRHCLLHGVDELDFLRSHSAAIHAYEMRRGMREEEA